jgi:dTDP-4-dehydrorhamnose 3,5-epimerase-like enzyme
VNAGQFTAIGNPYASAIDMRYITKTGVKDFFYAWDPKLAGYYGYGAYQTFSYDGSDYVVTPGGGSYAASGLPSNFIQSGQAFFVQGDTGGGSITFKEDAKTTGSALISAPARLPQPRLRANLYGVNADNTTYTADGLLINFDDSYSNSVDDMDAIKISNSSENLSVKTANKLLVVERRHTINSQDTIFLNLANTKAQKYRFEIAADRFDQQPGLTAFFEDNYLHTSTLLDLAGTTTIDFNIVNIPGSYAVNRFSIVFTPPVALPLTLTSVKAYQKNKDIAVEWTVENESNMKQYEVERSDDGNHFSKAGTIKANNNAATNYSWADVNPANGLNYYRIKSIDINDKIEYSKIVKVLIGKDDQSILVYPNPVTNGIINLQFDNARAGIYKIRLLDKVGKEIMSQQIKHTEGSSIETFQLNNSIANGIYQLEINKPDRSVMITNVSLLK